jgi:NitT/TauT family transport system substrate-binding protein
MRMPLFSLLRWITIGLFIFSSVIAGAEETPLKKLSFLPQWLPQAQFAGYYMALHKGFYREQGIDLTILQGGPTRSTVTYLKENKADIATLWLATALQLVDQGVAVVNIGQMVQRSALVLVVKRSSGIRTPAEMNGKKVGLWPADFQIQPRAFFDKFKLDVEVITTESPVSLFLRGGVQIASLMWYNEYHTLLNFGLDPQDITLFFFDDFSLNFPEDGVYLRKDTFEKDPAAAGAFMSATIKGWQYAFDHPEETLDYMISLMEKAHIPANRVHQKWMLLRMRDLMEGPKPEVEPMGVLKVEDYERVAHILLANRLIHAVPAYAGFFIKGVSR